MKNYNEEVIARLTNLQSVSYISDFLTHEYKSDFNTKSDARTYIDKLITDEGIEIKPKVTKSSQLKDYILNQKEVKFDKELIVSKCKDLEMTKSSIQYYVNSYKLAFDIVSKIHK